MYEACLKIIEDHFDAQTRKEPRTNYWDELQHTLRLVVGDGVKQVLVLVLSLSLFLFTECFKTNWSSHKGLHRAVQHLLSKKNGASLKGYDSLKFGVKTDDRSTWKVDVDLR